MLDQPNGTVRDEFSDRIQSGVDVIIPVNALANIMQ